METTTPNISPTFAPRLRELYRRQLDLADDPMNMEIASAAYHALCELRRQLREDRASGLRLDYEYSLTVQRVTVRITVRPASLDTADSAAHNSGTGAAL